MTMEHRWDGSAVWSWRASRLELQQHKKHTFSVEPWRAVVQLSLLLSSLRTWGSFTGVTVEAAVAPGPVPPPQLKPHAF